MDKQLLQDAEPAVTQHFANLDSYIQEATKNESHNSDLFTGADEVTKQKWHTIANGLLNICDGDFSQLHEQLARQIDDLGLAFRTDGGDDEREWPLNPMPLLIGTDEWENLSVGLIERAELLEQVLADIYGPQNLIRNGHLPASVVTGSEQFSRKMLGVSPPRGRYLHFYAVDLARGPDGEWRVLSDRVRLATGMGYALENRLAISRSTGMLLSSVNSRRIAQFFGNLRQGIAADCIRDQPRIALLTPGRFNQSYPEQAHLARYLGFPLVEGRDLIVSKGRLYVRTIAGLKRIDALWRWINTRHLDPLAFDSQSRIGVPDLFEAWSQGDLVVANWPGAGVVESTAFSAFMPSLCNIVYGRSLLLPNVATWWCGQEREKKHVIDNFDNLIISSSFGENVIGLPHGRSRAGASFSPAEKDEIIAAMHRRPVDYVGQEIVKLSTTPSLSGDKFEPRPFTIRAFVARDEKGFWNVMPGGFARISNQGVLRTSLMGDGDISADVCIVDDVPVAQESWLNNGQPPIIRRSEGILPSQAADNLYWFSRYCERAEMTTRVIRTMLGSPIEVDGGGGRAIPAIEKLVDIIIEWGAIDADTRKLTLPRICAAALSDKEKVGSVSSLITNCREIGRRLRDRLATDFWRITNYRMHNFNRNNVEAMIEICNNVLQRYGALAGLSGENMSRTHGWRFLDIGRRIERAVNICRMARKFAFDNPQADELGILLDLCDSQIIYRSRYISGLHIVPVLDLILLDKDNPRGLIYQVERILMHIENLPSFDDFGLPEKQLREAKFLSARLASLQAEDFDSDLMMEIETHLFNLSDAISLRYFLQFEKEDKAPMDRLF